jgi:peptidoglycan/xylan/chitin deacetylase (PgdA/CDA1 family)
LAFPSTNRDTLLRTEKIFFRLSEAGNFVVSDGTAFVGFLDEDGWVWIILPGLAKFVWKTGKFVRNFAAGALAPAIASTEWRRRHLLILGYHGVSIEDEHIWDGSLYMSPKLFRERLRVLQRAGCAVLPLGDAVRRLNEGTLPARAVVLAFDDGYYDFAAVVAPILAEFGYPATNFVSSYYAEFNRPIFDIMLRYLLWKGANKTLDLSGVLETPVKLDNKGQGEARLRIKTFAFERGLSGWDKDKLLGRLADALGIDYEQLCRKRLLHSMNAEEVHRMHAAGHSIQLHTHRHRVSRKRELFEREIQDNRRWLGQINGGAPLVHMSFPGDAWEPVQREWLTELGIETATTCRPGLAEKGGDQLRLPRFMDHEHVPEQVFRAWVSGSMAFFPQAKYLPGEGQILEDTIKMKSEVAL